MTARLHERDDLGLLPAREYRTHAVRGSQYTSVQFQRLMTDHGVVCPMSRTGIVWDNPAVKTERTTRRRYRMRDDAKADVFDYIERFYDPKRRPYDRIFESYGVRAAGWISLSRCRRNRVQLNSQTSYLKYTHPRTQRVDYPVRLVSQFRVKCHLSRYALQNNGAKSFSTGRLNRRSSRFRP